MLLDKPAAVDRLPCSLGLLDLDPEPVKIVLECLPYLPVAGDQLLGLLSLASEERGFLLRAQLPRVRHATRPPALPAPSRRAMPRAASPSSATTSTCPRQRHRCSSTATSRLRCPSTRQRRPSR